MGLMDREKLAPHQRARLIEEESARNADVPLWKAGKANTPDVVRTPQDLPEKWYRRWERELIARMSNVVPYDETKRYALDLVLAEWRRERAKKDAKKNAPTLF